MVSYSDQMGNKGAFIVFDKSLKPQFTTYEAVVKNNCVLLCSIVIFLASSQCQTNAVC